MKGLSGGEIEVCKAAVACDTTQMTGEEIANAVLANARLGDYAAEQDVDIIKLKLNLTKALTDQVELEHLKASFK